MGQAYTSGDWHVRQGFASLRYTPLQQRRDTTNNRLQSGIRTTRLRRLQPLDDG